MEENIDPISNGSTTFSNNDVFKKAFLWMFLGLLATGIIAWYTYSTGALFNFAMTGGLAILAIIEVVVVIVFSLVSHKLPPSVVGVVYFVYAAINGVTMSSIFYVYELGSIVAIFFVAAAVFGIFALLGYTTKIDLSKIGTIALALLLACIIVSIINLFLGNSFIDMVISWVVLVLFFGITAYDVQKIKNMAMVEGPYQDKLHIYAAMDIYLDFINIFLRILSLFGKRRN